MEVFGYPKAICSAYCCLKFFVQLVHEGSSEICLMPMSNMIQSYNLIPHAVRKIIRKSSVESHLKEISSFDFPGILLQARSAKHPVIYQNNRFLDFRLVM